MSFGTIRKKTFNWGEASWVEKHEIVVFCKYCNSLITSKIKRIKSYLQKHLEKKRHKPKSAHVDEEILTNEESAAESLGLEPTCCASTVSPQGI